MPDARGTRAAAADGAGTARWKTSTHVLVAATALIGLIAFPLLRPGWTFIK